MARKIHPAAIVDASAELGEGVEVGPYAVIEADVRIGEGCRILAGAVIRRFTEMGANNVVHPFAVLGGEPQDYKFDPAGRTYLRIGSDNIIREHVTLNRATREGAATVIGSGCYFMTQSHVGHDCLVGDGVILTNNAAVGGHCQIGPRAILSANMVVHQFCWIGEMVMTRGQTGASQHVPPFVMVAGVNFVSGLNTVGLRRNQQITEQDRRQIKEAYRLLYRSALTPRQALEQMDARADWGAPAGRFRDFIRRVLSAEKPYNRGLVTARPAQRGLESDQ
jgi:UDP-N-acetylglucosamine acyltransferase